VQNREAARYARWAAMFAGLLACVVAGVYARRAYHEARVRHKAPQAVPVTVQQQSAEFRFSKVEQNHTLFTVRAAHATQFKEENRSILQDVWVTIYGREGNRDDNIHTRECSYEPISGAIRCQGDVQLDLQGVNPGSGKPAGKPLEVKTRDLSFNRETGEASTAEAVEFKFPEGGGHAVGVKYSTHDSMVRLEHGVELSFSVADRTGNQPVTASGSSMEISRTNRLMVLHGPAKAKQGERELSANQISIDMDEEFHARHAVAEGRPVVHSGERGGQFEISADRFETFLSPSGWVQRVVAEGNIAGMRQSSAGTDHFSAARADLTMLSEHNLVRELLASGGVSLDSRQGADSRTVRTDSVLVKFAPGEHQGQQRMDVAETLAPGTIVTKAADETTTLRAKKFVARFASNGQLDQLMGHSGAEIRRQFSSGVPQIITTDELAATFGAKGDWETLDEHGKVRFQQADRQASAAHARIVRATDMVTLDGSPVLSDASSRTSAGGDVAINQKTGALRAAGGVISTYLSSPTGANTINLGPGPAHISSDSLEGSTTSGHAIYSGHVRLWQDQSLLNADQIELWRDEKKLEANGHVVAVFPQAPGQFGTPLGGSTRGATKPAHAPATGQAPGAPPGPVVWEIHAPTLTYWSDLGKGHLEGGVTANSQQGELVSRSLDVFLGPTTGNSAQSGPAGGRQLNRALALGNVAVRQGDRRGLAEQADYTAADGKFVLSGGQPTLTDAARDTTTGHSLTFFVANDTILIDSQEGSRTLTKHRVAK
jgi:lipopolysaccharide export system protein LptA/lipopolysaccharide export system protein LptC